MIAEVVSLISPIHEPEAGKLIKIIYMYLDAHAQMDGFQKELLRLTEFMIFKNIFLQFGRNQSRQEQVWIWNIITVTTYLNEDEQYSSSKSYKSAAMSSRRVISFLSHSICFCLNRWLFCTIASFTEGKSFRMRDCLISATNFIRASPALTYTYCRLVISSDVPNQPVLQQSQNGVTMFRDIKVKVHLSNHIHTILAALTDISKWSSSARVARDT